MQDFSVFSTLSTARYFSSIDENATCLRFPYGNIDQMLPFKVIGCGDEAAMTFSALFEGWLCTGSFRPCVYHGRGGAGKVESPDHRKNSPCARSVRSDHCDDVCRVHFALCNERTAKLINNLIFQTGGVAYRKMME